MAVLNQVKKNRRIWTILLILLCIGMVLFGGSYYISTLRQSLTEQAIANVLTVTRQHQQAFDTFISGDRERLHSYAVNFAKVESTDLEELTGRMQTFSEVSALYSLINLDTGIYFSNKSTDIYQLGKEQLEVYRTITGSGVRNSFQSLYSSDLKFGYYECFTFADGARGLVQKGYDRAQMTEEFSLSFYDGRGLGYVVTQEGEILLKSVDEAGRYSFDNIFDVIKYSSSNADVERFIQALSNQETGTAIFEGNDGNYLFTYVPVQSVKDWYLISIVPTAAVDQEADEILLNSQAMLLVMFIIVMVFITFFVFMWRSQRDLEEKDQEIEYRERQFDIFSTYLSNNTDDIYMLLDPERSQVEYVSPNVERVLGVPEADILADVRAFGRAKYVTRDTVTMGDLRKMNPGDSFNAILTERVNPQTGEHKWFREAVYCTTLQDEEKIVVYLSDRTKERQTQDTLSQALEVARVANKAKSTFLGSVSHDIRTPMNAIMGLTMLLREEANDPDRVVEYTQRIEGASQHLLGLINDVLDMNKIEGGNTTLNIDELDLPEIIEELNTIIRPQARAKNQTFKLFATSFSSEHLMGDKLRINQILINILSNAVKYTPEGGTIEMWVRELPQVMKDYVHLQFEIKDNGQGMSEEYLEVIFNPFTREQNTTTNLIQGTGLGMAITKSLVDLMGGAIRVESEVDKGSTFTVELELRVQERQEDPQFWKENGLVRMIVADDDEEVCQNVVKAMSKTGVTVHYATSGQKAIETMRAARERGEPYDLILLDWKMPDLDGLETARLIRKNYPHKIPILFFTAYDWRDIEHEAADIGAEHFLAKPFFMYSFKEAVTRVMGGQAKPSALDKTDGVVAGKHILVVDDVEVNRMILVKILNTLGAECEIAENGQIAVDKFTASQPGTYDLILMDVQMPVMDGHAATRTIRASQHPEAKSVAIIAMTANAFMDDVRNALDAGMDAHVAKPIVLDQLKNTIQEVMDRKKQQARV